MVQDKIQYWYHMGNKHRENDLPAYIKGDDKIWYDMDKNIVITIYLQ